MESKHRIYLMQVRIREMSESEPRMTRRKALSDVETKYAWSAWDKPVDCLGVVQAASGVKVA